MTPQLHAQLTAAGQAAAGGVWRVAGGYALLTCGIVVLLLLIRIAGLGAGRPWLSRIERKRLMTPAEVRFWHVLETALPDQRIFAQVAMGALLKPVAGLSGKEWWSTFGRFSQKVVDFVVVDSAGEVIAIVELDDHSHVTAKDQARDALLACGGYPVVRFLPGDGRNPAVVRARLIAGAEPGPQRPARRHLEAVR
ncbi:DUF2726 domain-containing protein (plasmid) [Polymorphobacter sp. PAMC 29334]|uniref:DUF2726 domain-containing protein n=1 Tax=Polymorphobacter sp. PAMC 29334 TaxID=2862331 RepID=UPI001C74EDE8|nr:DUF2726 domain-containing protein [Polymorphobacter sp. PAMC 29334]QYE33143.1 DUF2726 domain-containing protein [Polymorphobacter sp. PAMC 29334]